MGTVRPVTGSRCGSESLTLRTRDDWAALIFALLHGTLLADGLGEGADAEIAHQHAVMASTVEAGLIRHDPVTLRVVVVIIIAAGLCGTSRTERESVVMVGRAGQSRGESSVCRIHLKPSINHWTDELCSEML